MNTLHFCLCFMLCMCGLLMCLTVNPVESVLFLILAFCNAAAILFMFHAEFLGLIFIIIYVGAIAVLFLFVIMMLNVKNQENENESAFRLFMKGGFLRGYLIGFFFIFLIAGIYHLSFSIIHTDMSFFYDQHTDLILMIDNLNNIDIMGQVLFNYFLICFLLAGIILLIALIGSIVLTLRFNNSEKGQFVNRQLARTDNFLAFYK